jgi:putative SOS response-associated peptidase YedK
MCGRLVMVSPFDVISEIFGIEEARRDLHPSYNILPGQPVYAVISEGPGGTNRLVQLRWGLVPSWAKDPSVGNRMINARAESVDAKPSFWEAFSKRRCLVIADGFYEWQKKDSEKIPFFARLKTAQPFGFAGLYEVWTSPKSEVLKTCAIITTQANDLMGTIHDRMPVIVPEDLRALWLDPTIKSKDILLDILKTCPTADLDLFEVSRSVNSSHSNSPDLIQPLPHSR